MCFCCGKKKDNNCGSSPAVAQINNSECVLFHKVEVPASMGDSTTNPPKNGAYKNVLLAYEADGEVFFYSSDGIPTRLTKASTDYNLLTNKPSINGVTLSGDKTSENLGLQSVLTAGENISIDNNVISATGMKMEILSALPEVGELNVLYLVPSAHPGMFQKTITGTTLSFDDNGNDEIYSLVLHGRCAQDGTPTPTSHVPVNVVTGAQTITINGTNYTIDLGSTELYSIPSEVPGARPFTDQIKYTNGVWTIEKTIGRQTINANSVSKYDIYSNLLYATISKPTTALSYNDGSTTLHVYTTVAPEKTHPNGYNTTENIGYFMTPGLTTRYIVGYANGTTEETMKSELAGGYIYYIYTEASRTTTTITDATLISQLNAVRNAQLASQNTITTSATGTNLGFELELTYNVPDVHRQYDEYVWTGGNFELIGQ